ncbi:MAG: ARMT1-like domain-containing protein [bacterium]|nr:ARMT1-like domain-containing protein [bacterium]
MKTYLDCIPCFFRQALDMTRITGVDETTQKKVLNEVSKLIPDFPLDASPPKMGREIYRIVKGITGKDDPFKKIKQKSNKLVLDIYLKLKEKIRSSDDKLLAAVELAIAGNVIDYGVKNSLDIDKEIEKILAKDFAGYRKGSKCNFDYQEFKDVLNNAGSVLYLGDNAGEIVFDKLLIEELIKISSDIKIVYAVRDKPVINDVLIEDAVSCGLDKIVDVISSGCDAPGTILDLCSKDFLELYKNAELVISKGQGNFETLADGNRAIFFLFKVKCPVIASHTGFNLGDIVLKKV